MFRTFGPTSIVTSWEHQSFLCCSFPYFPIIQVTILWMVKYALVEGQPYARASKIREASSLPSPDPPASSGA